MYSHILKNLVVALLLCCIFGCAAEVRPQEHAALTTGSTDEVTVIIKGLNRDSYTVFRRRLTSVFPDAQLLPTYDVVNLQKQVALSVIIVPGNEVRSLLRFLVIDKELKEIEGWSM